MSKLTHTCFSELMYLYIHIIYTPRHFSNMYIVNSHTHALYSFLMHCLLRLDVQFEYVYAQIASNRVRVHARQSRP